MLTTLQQTLHVLISLNLVIFGNGIFNAFFNLSGYFSKGNCLGAFKLEMDLF